jgi:hypothetical protein
MDGKDNVSPITSVRKYGWGIAFDKIEIFTIMGIKEIYKEDGLMKQK